MAMKDWQEYKWREPKKTTAKRISANVTRNQLHEAIKKASKIQPAPGKDTSLSPSEKKELFEKLIKAAQEVNEIAKKNKVVIYWTTK